MPRRHYRYTNVICHITDAGGVVHLGHVARRLVGHQVGAFVVGLACAPVAVAQECRTEQPEGYALPKVLTEIGMLVTYKPEGPRAPPITCVRCVAWAEVARLWRSDP